MASGTIFRSWLVEENRFGSYDPRQFVTLSAAHVLMCTAQRKGRAFLMIEEGRFPLHAGVALGTSSHARFRELFSVNILMAVFALHRSRLEVHVQQLGFEIRRLVAGDAGRRSMRAR